MAGVYGTWKLVRGQSKDPNGAPLPPPYGGAKAIGTVVRFEDDLMILQPPPKDVNGVTYHRELSWRKIADG
jgi:hypothetical protein